MRILASAALAAALLSGVAARVAAPALAQTSTPVTATLYDEHLSWQTTAGALVTVELKRGAPQDLQLVASGISLANDAGLADVELLSLDASHPANALLRPGDALHLVSPGTSMTVTVPANFDAEYDGAGDRVFGRAPEGASLLIAVDPDGSGNPSILRSLVVGRPQTFDLDLSGVTNLLASGSATVEFTDTQGNHWSANTHGFEATAILGSNRALGSGTPGRGLTVTVLAAGTAALKLQNAVLIRGDNSWMVPEPGAPSSGVLLTGDLLRFERDAGSDGLRTVEVTAPSMNLTLDTQLGRLIGSAPPGSVLVAELYGPSGEYATLPIVVGGTGTYFVSLSGVAAVGPGWRAAVTFEAQDGIRFQALATVTQLHVVLDSGQVTGIVNPGSLISATLSLGQSSFVKGFDLATADIDGGFELNLHDSGGAEVFLTRGDRLVYQVSGAAPQSITLPAISAQTFAASDTVSGRAVADSRVVVSYDGGPAPIAKTVTAGPNGSFSASFIGLLDIKPPMMGRVLVTGADGVTYETGWAAVSLQVDLAKSTIAGNGWPGRSASAVLASGPETLAGASTRVPRSGGPGFPPRWALGLVDLAGSSLSIRAGDLLTVTVGDDVIILGMPDLSASIQVNSNQVTGHATPGAALTLQVKRLVGDPSKTVPLTADGGGNFSYTFTGAAVYDIKYNDSLNLTMASGPHTFTRSVPAPGVQLLLDLGQVVGVAKPDTPLAAELRGPTGLRAVATFRSRADGGFQADLGQPDFPVAPEAGDTLTIRPLGVAGETFTLTVPELSVKGDPNANVVQGKASPGGSLWIGAFDTFPHSAGFNYGELKPPIGADGSFLETFENDTYEIDPGTEVSAIYFAPSGQSASLTRHVPVHSLLYGGDQACGYVGARQGVSANLLATREGSLGQGSTRSGRLEDYSLTLLPTAANTQTYVASGVGQTLRVTAGSIQRDLPVPLIDLLVSPESGLATGRGPARSTLLISQGSHGCLESARPGAARVLAVQEPTDEEGLVVASLPSLRPGDAIELSVWDKQGFRFYSQYLRTLLQAWVGTDRLTGLASPMAPLSASVYDSLGSQKAALDARAGGGAEFDLHLGGPALIPGDRVDLAAPEGLVTLTVEDLTLTSAPGEDIAGTAPAGRSVRIELLLQDGRRLRLPWRAAADGKVRFTAADIPPRADWSFAQVEGVRLVLPTAGGHEIVTETVRTLPAPTPIPTETPTPGPSPTPTIVPSATRVPTNLPKPTLTPSITPIPGQETATPEEPTPFGSETTTPPGPTSAPGSRTPTPTRTPVAKPRIYLPYAVKKVPIR